MDDATYRLGLGWRARSRHDRTEFSEPAECTAVLNDIVRVVLNDICEMLHGLSRESVVTGLLLNHERAACGRDHWNRTARANVALHSDKDATIRRIIEHHAELNACGIACRILLEAAICECPLSGGAILGQLDLSRLLGLSVSAFHLGGWSDAIHWGAAEPRVRITPLGDVHLDHTFMDAIYEPFGRLSAENNFHHAVKSYGNLFTSADPDESASNVLEARFLEAWKAEFGITLDGAMEFVGALESAHCHPPIPCSIWPLSTLAKLCAETACISLQEALDSLKLFILPPRTAWRTVQAPFTDKDWYPWRFRRRLNLGGRLKTGQ